MKQPPRLAEPDFLRLFVKHEEALRAYARVLLPNWEAVHEVMQEASVVMWKKLEQLDSAEGFLPWAKVIVRFEALRLRREFSRDRHVFSEEVLQLLAQEAEAVPEDRWERERRALQHCLGKLAAHHRELVLASCGTSGNVVRIAEATGRTVNSLYKQLGRLRTSLSQCVKNTLATWGPA